MAKNTTNTTEFFTISKFSKLTNTTEQTLRNWDKNNTLKPHHISTSGYRYYSTNQILEVEVIKQKKRAVIQNKIKALNSQLKKLS